MSARSKTTSLSILQSPDEIRLVAWTQLLGTVQRLQRLVVAELASLDVTVPQFDVLATLRFNQGVTQQELAERLLVTKGNICGLIDRLESAGYVKRQPDPNDGRSNRLFLTPAGAKRIDAILPRHDRLVVRIMTGLPTGEVQQLHSLLQKLQQATENDTF